MFEEGIKFPLESDDAVKRIVIGGLLGIFSFLIVPGLALVGYYIEVARAGVERAPEPPAFTDWGDLIVKGIVGIVISIAYAIVPLILVFLTTGVGFAGAARGGTAGGIVGGLGAIGMLVTLLALLVVYYAIPAALVNYAIEDSIGAAFDWGAIKPVLLSGDYLIAWLVPFVLAFVLNIVAIILAVTVVGLILLPFLQFYVYVAVMYMFGRAFAKASGAETTDDAEKGVAA